MSQQISGDQINHKTGMMDGTMNNYTWTNSTAGTANITMSTSDCWFPYYIDSTWEPYDKIEYYPAWHLLVSYGVKTPHRHCSPISRFVALVKGYFCRDVISQFHYQKIQPK